MATSGKEPPRFPTTIDAIKDTPSNSKYMAASNSIQGNTSSKHVGKNEPGGGH